MPAAASQGRVSRHGVKASCEHGHLEETCSVTGLPVIKDIGFDVRIDTANLEIDVLLLVLGKNYSALKLSAHNPDVCIPIKIAKVCVKIKGLTWTNHVVQGTLYVGVGIGREEIGREDMVEVTEWFKVVELHIPYLWINQASYGDALLRRSARHSDSVVRAGVPGTPKSIKVAFVNKCGASLYLVPGSTHILAGSWVTGRQPPTTLGGYGDGYNMGFEVAGDAATGQINATVEYRSKFINASYNVYALVTMFANDPALPRMSGVQVNSNAHDDSITVFQSLYGDASTGTEAVFHIHVEPPP